MWPLGAIVAQACHASTAVMHMFREDPYTVEYLSDLDRMHKVVLKVSLCVHVSVQCAHVLMHYVSMCVQRVYA